MFYHFFRWAIWGNLQLREQMQWPFMVRCKPVNWWFWSSTRSRELCTYSDEWQGSIWARNKCISNESFYFSCETVDWIRHNELSISTTRTYPVTLLNFNINQSVVSYEVSLNHGHNNVAVRIEPIGGTLVDGSWPFPIVNYVQDISNVRPYN